MKTLKSAANATTEPKSKTSTSSDLSRTTLLDKEQQQQVELASSSKDAGQWKTPKKIDLSPRKVSLPSTHCDKLPGQKKATLPRQISAEDVAQILNPPKLSASKSGPAQTTKEPQEFCNDEVGLQTDLPDEVLHEKSANDQQCTPATDLSKTKNLLISVKPLTEGDKSSLEEKAKKSSQNNSHQITFEDNAKPSEPRKDTEDQDATTGKDGKKSETSKPVYESSKTVSALFFTNPVISVPSKDTSETEMREDSSITPSKEEDKLSEVSKTTSDPPQPVFSQLQSPSSANSTIPSESSKVISEESAILTPSREDEKISDVLKSTSEPSQPVLPSANPITVEQSEEMEMNEDSTVTPSTSNKPSEVSRSTSESPLPLSASLQSTSDTNQISSEANERKRKPFFAPVRETRSMTEKKNSKMRPKRPWPTR